MLKSAVCCVVWFRMKAVEFSLQAKTLESRSSSVSALAAALVAFAALATVPVTLLPSTDPICSSVTHSSQSSERASAVAADKAGWITYGADPTREPGVITSNGSLLACRRTLISINLSAPGKAASPKSSCTLKLLALTSTFDSETVRADLITSDCGVK